MRLAAPVRHTALKLLLNSRRNNLVYEIGRAVYHAARGAALYGGLLSDFGSGGLTKKIKYLKF